VRRSSMRTKATYPFLRRIRKRSSAHWWTRGLSYLYGQGSVRPLPSAGHRSRTRLPVGVPMPC
jgi:hypothetical protein